MLESQRHLFDMPRDVAYFNAAGWSPIPKAVAAAGQAGALRKAQPWKLDGAFMTEQHERARRAAARVVNASPDDVSLIPSVGYGVSTAAKNLAVGKGQRVLVLEDDHSSPVLEWMGRAEAQGFTLDTVKRPTNGDWTSAVLEAIDRKGAADLAVVSISSIHWSDGGAIDLDKVTPAAKAKGAAIVIDATHAAGVMDLDVTRLDPDYLIFPTYKWLLGPYGRAFLYVAKRHQSGVPLEQTSPARIGVKAEQNVYFADLRYLPDARRFDMGERDHFISLEMAAVGIETVNGLGRAAIETCLSSITAMIGEKAQILGNRIAVPDSRFRAPHIISLSFTGGMPTDLLPRLAAGNVHAAQRIGRLRVSPHVYNDEVDVDRLIGALAKSLA